MGCRTPEGVPVEVDGAKREADDSVARFMAMRGITDADLDRMAAPYEDGTFEPEPDGEVFIGSHVGT